MFLFAILLSGFVAVSAQMTGSGAGDGESSELPQLVEMVDPWIFTGVMSNYEYDLYEKTPGGLRYVPPPLYDYADPVELDYPVLKELRVATDQIQPASRETEVKIFANGTKFFVGTPMVITYEVHPATKTVILEGGAATATVEIWPENVDAYVAFRNARKEYFFLNAYSCTRDKFFRYPVAFAINATIERQVGIVTVCWPSTKTPYGQYTLFAVLVPTGADVRDSGNWISNLAYTFVKIGVR